MLFGTTDGQIVVMSSTGAMLAQLSLGEGKEISSMAWSCPKFFLEDQGSNRDVSENESGMTRFVQPVSVLYL